MTQNIVFSGSLLFLSLADIFQLLGGNNCNGMLILRSPYSADTGVVYFKEGNPVNASWGKLKGLDAVYALFGWTDGTYEFSEQALTGMVPVIERGMMEILLDALRLLDDGAIARVGPDPFYRAGIDNTGPDRINMTYLHPTKGPLVDYHYATIENSYPDGAVIVKEGKSGRWLWIICEGTVRIIKETSRGPLTLARLGEGCFIGTVGSFVYGEYERSATVIAEGNVQLCILDIEILHREYSALSGDFKKILHSLDNRLRAINENAVAAFTGVYTKELPTDKVFDDRFQHSTDLYIVREGTADIIGKGPEGEVNLLSLSSGDVFGKIPFMAFGHEPLSASVMVSETFQADVMDSRALQKEYNRLSDTFRNFVFSVSTNVSMTTKLFYQLLHNQKKISRSIRPGEDES